MDLIFRNVIVINEGHRLEADVGVKNGRIAAIGAIGVGAPREIDGRGRWLVPGMIDDQVHFREPGFPDKANIGSESRAAVAGGITSFMDMPNTDPPAITQERLADKYVIGAQTALANYSFYMGTTNSNLEEVCRTDPTRVCGIKIFMGSSTGDMLVDNETTLEGFFREAPTLISTHCEDTPMIESSLAAIRAEHGDELGPEWHPRIRHHEACLASSTLAVELARRHGTRLNVLHLTTADEMVHFDVTPLGDDKLITSEVCLHHLTFCDEDYAEQGNNIKCNPAIKTAADRAVLRRAISEGRLDIIATDHAPHTVEEKSRPFLTAPAGVPLVQHAWPLLLNLIDEGHLSAERAVTASAHSVAEVFGIVDRGYLREGYWADLVLIDPEARWNEDNARLLSKCGWSPFAGREFAGRVDLTCVNGQVVYEDGALIEGSSGARLEFRR